MKLKLNLTVRRPSRAGGLAAAGVTNARRAPPPVKTAARARLLQAARAGREPDPERARLVRVVEYEVEDRGNATVVCP